MCLQTVDEKLDGILQEGTGWKVVDVVDSGHYTSQVYEYEVLREFGRPYCADTLASDTCHITSACGAVYKSGFHVFTDLEAATLWHTMQAQFYRNARITRQSRIVRVHYCGVVAAGTQLCGKIPLPGKILVVRKMTAEPPQSIASSEK